MRRLILIRHGESTWNQERRIQGNLDPGLSDRGRLQAALLGDRLKGGPFTALHTSTLRRALETATVLGDALGLLPQPADGLREINLGAWEGKTAPEIRTEWGDAYDRWLDRPLDASAPLGGEGLRDFQQRAVGALEKIYAGSLDGDLLIVAHGGVIKAYLCHILGLDLNRFFRIKVDNTALTEIAFIGETAHLTLLNDTCHLNGQRLAVPRRSTVPGGEQPHTQSTF